MFSDTVQISSVTSSLKYNLAKETTQDDTISVPYASDLPPASAFQKLEFQPQKNNVSSSRCVDPVETEI